MTITTSAAPEKVVRFTIPGEPKSKQRPRVTARGTYTPKETKQAEKVIANAWAQIGAEPFQYQVVVSIDFHNGNKRRRDLDNMAKLVLDALNKRAYEDDYQVVGLNLRKFQTTPDKARTLIILEEVIEWSCETKTVRTIPGTGQRLRALRTD
jgi:Holliday junction resolvase RusA-like endonuclease